jgi:hypothetical protein
VRRTLASRCEKTEKLTASECLQSSSRLPIIVAMKMWLRTDAEQRDEQSPRQGRSVNPTSPGLPWSRRRPVSTMSLRSKNPADHALRRDAACRRSAAADCARCSALDQPHSLAHAEDSLRRGAARYARFSVLDQRHSSADISPLSIGYPLPHLQLSPQQFSQKIPRFPAISNRNWLANRSYRKHTTNPRLTGTRIAYCGTVEFPNIDAKMNRQGAPHASA